MIDKLTERQKFWNEHHIIEKQGTSSPNPFRNTLHWSLLYHNSCILEIGPGEGRQFDVLSQCTDKYSVADVSDEVLSLDKYKKCINAYQIKDWSDDIGMTFDVICFWYVIHHITRMEGGHFFEFLSRHTLVDNYIHFNYPHLPKRHRGLSSVEGGDGIKTTDWTSEIIGNILVKHGFELVDASGCATEPNNYVVLARKVI